MLGQRNGLPRTISGFINRPYQDTPGSTDISKWCGHIDVEKNLKQIGLEYTELINTADRSEYPKAEYTVDFTACLNELSPEGSFGDYIRDSLYSYIKWLKNKYNDVNIVKMPRNN